MRIFGILVLVLGILALPVGSAVGKLGADVPDTTLHVKGQTVSADSSSVGSSQAPGAGTTVSTKDTDTSVSGVRCAVDPSAQAPGVSTKVESPCDAKPGVKTTASTDVVDAKLNLHLAPAAGPSAPAQSSVQQAAVAAPPAEIAPTVLMAAAAAGASALGLYAAWRVLKWTGLAALLPLYSHITDDEILDDANRAAIYRLIQAEPGISTKDVADRLDLAWGTVTHHLGKLEKRRFVVSKKYGKYRRYFANGQGGVQEKDALAVLRVDRTGDVAALIKSSPGMTQKAVSQALGVSSSTILWHVKRLEEVRLVTKVREGKLVRYYPADGAPNATLIAAAPVTAA